MIVDKNKAPPHFTPARAPQAAEAIAFDSRAFTASHAMMRYRLADRAIK